MPEQYDDPTLWSAFARYRAEVVDEVPAQNVTEVRARARSRRQTRLTVLGVVTAVALVVPAAAYGVATGAGGGRHHDVPGHPRPSTSVSGTPSPSGSVSPSPSSSPPSAGATAPGDRGPSGSTSAPNGRITITELTKTRLDLPPWGLPNGQDPLINCPTSQATIHSGKVQELQTVTVENVWYADVDGDHGTETVALLNCQVGQGADRQVVALDRDRSGAVVVLGQVVRNELTGTGVIQQLYDARANGDGSVSVEVSDLFACCGTHDEQAEHQWRRYAWDGGQFRQTGGPTAFHPVPTAYGTLTATVQPVVLSTPDTSGSRTGTAKVTVTNAGPGTAPGVRLHLAALTEHGDRIEVQFSGDAPGCSKDDDGYVCHYPELAAGTSKTYTITLTSPKSNDASITAGTHVSLYVNAEQPGIRVLGDYEPVTSFDLTLGS